MACQNVVIRKVPFPLVLRRSPFVAWPVTVKFREAHPAVLSCAIQMAPDLVMTSMEVLKIILLCIVAAVVYGIVHDQVTARVCVEYFTMGHPRLIASESPTDLGLLWGVIATWWAGAMIGVPLAASARAGSRPKLPLRQLTLPVGILMLAMALLATAAGFTGYLAASRGWVWLVGPMADEVPREAHVRFLACLWTHLASYAGGFLGGAVLCAWAWRARRRATPG